MKNYKYRAYLEDQDREVLLPVCNPRQFAYGMDLYEITANKSAKGVTAYRYVRTFTCPVSQRMTVQSVSKLN